MSSRRSLTLAAALIVAAAGCGESTDSETASTTTLTPETAVEETAEPVLVTSCLQTGPGLTLPETYIAADVSAPETCEFVLQAENLADTTVIAGELYSSSAGRTFADFVDFVADGLAAGQEPDILALQLLNSGASGRDLPILDRRDIDGPNRAVVFTHESDRRSGFTALSAVVDVPTDGTGPTQAILLWGLSNPTNDQLILDFIDSLTVTAL